MGILTKELFISTIESVREQIIKDREYSESATDLFNFNEGCIPTYDNSLLIKSIVLLLQVSFPKSGAFCDIEHYMFDLNFGRGSQEEELITVEDLWYQLTNA